MEAKAYPTAPVGPVNYGLDIERELREHSEEDWMFGATESKRCIALIPQEKRERYLPKGEVQRGKEDFMDCASRGPVNDLEAKFTYLLKEDLLDKEDEDWFKKKGYIESGRITFSDRFISIKSGTTHSGNSLKGPIDAIHRYGLIPKKMLPAKESMTFAQYQDPKSITPKMDALGLEFLTRFTVNYERVLAPQFSAAIDEDMLVVGGYAWPFPVNGEYPRDLRMPNHAFLYFKTPRYHIFDNYIEGRDDYIKKLAADYILMDYGYRLFISKTVSSATLSLIDELIARVLKILEELQALKERVGAMLKPVWRF